MKRQWYYRGSLKACNYSCSYCPFSKQKAGNRERKKDREAFQRFVREIHRREDISGAVQVVPYGEALVHPYYWEGLASLSQNTRIDAVGAQSNFSFPVEQMLELYRRRGGDVRKLRLWGTFHPEMVSVEQFARQCRLLSAQNVLYCAGAVGVPGQLGQIQKLRRELPASVYLWVNRMDGLGRAYTHQEIDSFLAIDEYFELELMHHRAVWETCRDNRFVEADGTMHRCNLCRRKLGNLYGAEDGQGADSRCARKECRCYLAYCNQPQEQLFFFQPYPAFRIPSYPKAVFFDVDGTLVPDGHAQIPGQYAKRLCRLAQHSAVYLATSLPPQEARKKLLPVWDILHGGVFGGGGRWIVWDASPPGGHGMEAEKNISPPGGHGVAAEKNALPPRGHGVAAEKNALPPRGHEPAVGKKKRKILDEIEPIDISWLCRAQEKAGQYGMALHLYKRGDAAYKVTLVRTVGRKLPEGGMDGMVEEFGIPESCQVFCEGNCIQVISREAGKLQGILHICQSMGYHRQDVAVFGDGGQDIPMLKYFPLSAAAKGSSAEVRNCVGIRL